MSDDPHDSVSLEQKVRPLTDEEVDQFLVNCEVTDPERLARIRKLFDEKRTETSEALSKTMKIKDFDLSLFVFLIVLFALVLLSIGVKLEPDLPAQTAIERWLR